MTGPNVNKGEGPSDTPSSLLDRVKANDLPAWERFVYLFTPLIYRWCRQSGMQEADAADVGQDVFKAVFVAISDFKHDSLRGWLRTVTINKIRDFRRKRSRESSARGGSTAARRLQQVPDDDLPPEDERSIRLDNLLIYRRAVQMILDGCEERTGRVFRRLVADNHRASDIAADEGLTLNAVYLIKSRVLRRIRAEFAELVVS